MPIRSELFRKHSRDEEMFDAAKVVAEIIQA